MPVQSLTLYVAANELIASLRSELATQKDLAKEAKKSQQQLEISEAKVDSLQAQVTGLTTSLADSKTEIKALNTKLNAARAAEATATAQAQVATARVPGSAMKASVMGARGLDQGQVQAAQNGKMKENLYSDLTGLVVTGVKRDGPEDVYDCIQTGRNGSKYSNLETRYEAMTNITFFQHFTSSSPLPMRTLTRTWTRPSFSTNHNWTSVVTGRSSRCSPSSW